MSTYFDHYAGQRATYQPRACDTVEAPEILVLEGEAAADSMRRWVSAEERRALESASFNQGESSDRSS